MTGNTNKERKRLDRERIQAQKERRKRLEKAAPELLVACKAALRTLDAYYGDVPKDGGHCCNNYFIIKDAIALAEEDE